MNAKRRLVGAAIATTAASLFLAGAAGMAAEEGAAAGSVLVKCYGANACKGKSDCKTSMSSCKGKNECKGKGFMKMTEQECIEALGRK